MDEISAIHEIQLKAKEALQKADGEELSASQELGRWLDSREDLQQALLEKLVRWEVDQAARQLRLNLSRCPYCQEEIFADSKKCRHCGEWLDPAAARTNPAFLASRAWHFWYFILFTGWVLVLVVVALIYSLSP